MALFSPYSKVRYGANLAPYQSLPGQIIAAVDFSGGSYSPLTAEVGATVTVSANRCQIASGAGENGLYYNITGRTAGELLLVHCRGYVVSGGGEIRAWAYDPNSGDAYLGDKHVPNTTSTEMYFLAKVPAGGAIKLRFFADASNTVVFETIEFSIVTPMPAPMNGFEELFSSTSGNFNTNDANVTRNVTGGAMTITPTVTAYTGVRAKITGLTPFNWYIFRGSFKCSSTGTILAIPYDSTNVQITEGYESAANGPYEEFNIPFRVPLNGKVDLAFLVSVVNTTGSVDFAGLYALNNPGTASQYYDPAALFTNSASGSVFTNWGDAAQSLNTFTNSGSGVHGVQSVSSSQTLSTFINSASGAHGVQSTSASQSFDSVANSASGTHGVQSTSADQSLNTFTNSATGVHGVQSTSASQTFSDFANSATGVHGVQSTGASQSFNSFTHTATGSEVVATASQSFDTFTHTANGVHGVSGTAAQTFNDFVHAASSEQTAYGSAEQTLDTFSQTANGVHGVSGTAAQSLASFTNNASTVIGNAGTAASSFNSFTNTASAGHGVSGTAASSFNAFPHTASAGHGVSGTAAQSFSSFTNSAVGTGGVVAVSATASQLFSNFFASASASVGDLDTILAENGTGIFLEDGSLLELEYNITAVGPFQQTATAFHMFGTATQTLNNFSQSGIGYRLVLGTSARSVSFTHSAEGYPVVIATKARLFNNFVQTTAGAVGVTATGSPLFSSFVNNGQASQPVFGTGSPTISAYHTGLGQVTEIVNPVTGSAAQTFPPVYQGASAAQLYGAATQVYNGWRQTADGGPVVIGTADHSPSSFRSLVEAYVVILGTSSVTFNPSASASGAHYWGAGVGQQTFTNFVQTTNAVHGVVAAPSTQSFNSFTNTANGVLIGEASGAGTFNQFFQSSNGTVGHQGSADQTILVLNAANGQAGVQGSAFQFLPIVHTAQAYRVVFGIHSPSILFVQNALGERIVGPYNSPPDPTRTVSRDAEIRTASYPAEIRNVSTLAEIRKVG